MKLHLFVQYLHAIQLTLVIKSLKIVLWCVLEEAEAAISIGFNSLTLIMSSLYQEKGITRIFCANLSNPFKLLLWNVDIMAFRPIKVSLGNTCA